VCPPDATRSTVPWRRLPRSAVRGRVQRGKERRAVETFLDRRAGDRIGRHERDLAARHRAQVTRQLAADARAEQQRADDAAARDDRRRARLVVAGADDEHARSRMARQRGLRQRIGAALGAGITAHRGEPVLRCVEHLEQVTRGDDVEVARHARHGRAHLRVAPAAGQREHREEAWIAHDHLARHGELAGARIEHVLEHRGAAA
jgi:hypothetical protein